MTEIPVNCLFNKKKTGCGATELAIRNSIPTLIAMPYVALVKNKTVCRTDDIEVLGVYEDITEWDITQFARTHSPLKIATTYDSLPRVVSALQSIGIDPFIRSCSCWWTSGTCCLIPIRSDTEPSENCLRRRHASIVRPT